MKELKDLLIGDKVVVFGHFTRRIGVISKITKTQLVVDGTRFNRTSGWQCGSWHTLHIRAATEEDIKEIDEEETRKKLLYMVRDCNFKSLSTDQLKQVCDIINSANQLKREEDYDDRRKED